MLKLFRKTPKPRPTTEATGPQCGRADVLNGFGSMLLNGNTQAPPAGYQTYRAMLTDPTIAMGLATALAPVKSAKWMYTVTDKGTDQQLQFVQDQLTPLAFNLKRDMTHAVVMGHQPFEVVWNQREGMWGFEKIKPLMPDLTRIVVGDKGEYVGLVNTGVELDDGYSFNFVYDDECGGQKGRSRFENLRVHAWAPWLDAMRQQGAYIQKGAGVLTIVHYPQGTTPDRDGSEKDNADLAQGLLDRMGMGKGIAMPQSFSAWAADARELINAGVDPKMLMAWQIQFMEHRAGVGAEISTQLAYLDKLKARGLLVPERAFQEGTSGTRADAGAHGDIALYAAEELNQDIAGTVNRELVDELLVQNWGENARGAVMIEPAPLSDAEKAMFQDIVKGVLVANPDLLLGLTDVDGIFDKAGIPKAEDTIDGRAFRIGFDPNAGDPQVDPAQAAADEVMATDGQAVQDAALNGAQLKSMVELVSQITTKQLPAVRAMLALAFPTANTQLIDKIIAAASKFKPPPIELPPAPRVAPRAVMSLRRVVRNWAKGGA